MTKPVSAVAPDSIIVDPEHPGTLLSLCKASADQLRLDVLRVLSRDSFGVTELCSIFDCRQSGMSHHLKILATAGLVTARREGNSVFYRRIHRTVDDPLYPLQEALQRVVDSHPLPPIIAERISQVQRERAASSQAFFAENADKFGQQQEQMVAYELYGPHAVELLTRTFVDRVAGSVLEVGPGEGAFLAELSPRFRQVYALDNSKRMLEKARQFAAERGLGNIHFLQGDTKDERLAELALDCAVINMVLHHTPSPADLFFDLARVLKRDGQLYVTDLCRHDQDWARQSCGDLWLGFEPEDLTQWAAEAGFKTGENIYLAQRNGFRVQIRQFSKL